jgi:peptide deformylase
MAVRETLQIGDPRLKAKNAVVKKVGVAKIKQVTTDLVETMRHNDSIGMAAPQIGENYRIFVTEPRKTTFRSGVTDTLRVYINPKIMELSDKLATIYEGCASVLNGQLFGPVRRPREIMIEATDEKGKQFRLRCDGILARVIQHEYDHLRGVEFTEKIEDYKMLMQVDFYKDRVKNSPEQLEAAEITVCKVEWI